MHLVQTLPRCIVGKPLSTSTNHFVQISAVSATPEFSRLSHPSRLVLNLVPGQIDLRSCDHPSHFMHPVSGNVSVLHNQLDDTSHHAPNLMNPMSSQSITIHPCLMRCGHMPLAMFLMKASDHPKERPVLVSFPNPPQ